MKKIKLIFSIVFLLAVTISCTDDSGIDTDASFSNSPTSDLSNIFEVRRGPERQQGRASSQRGRRLPQVRHRDGRARVRLLLPDHDRCLPGGVWHLARRGRAAGAREVLRAEPGRSGRPDPAALAAVGDALRRIPQVKARVRALTTRSLSESFSQVF